MTGAHHYYRMYGLRVRSDIPVPHLRTLPPAEPEVVVRYGKVPVALPGAVQRHGLWQAAPGDFVMAMEHTARYRVTGGREVVVQPLGGGEDQIRGLLAGTIWTAVLQQRGLLTLHASAIRTDAGAVLFLGASASGKSTLASAFVARGYPLLTDDVAAVQCRTGNPPVVMPGLPGLRLWADALERLQFRTTTLRRVRPDLDKYVLPVKAFSDGPEGVRAVYVLSVKNREAVELVPLGPAKRFMWLSKYTHRRKFAKPFGRQAAHFETVARIAQETPTARVVRPVAGFSLDALADRVERHMGGCPP